MMLSDVLVQFLGTYEPSQIAIYDNLGNIISYNYTFDMNYLVNVGVLFFCMYWIFTILKAIAITLATRR